VIERIQRRDAETQRRRDARIISAPLRLCASALFFLILGVALVILYRDGDQQDAGYHYLFARWSWAEPGYLLGVWARPLVTLLYSLPAQFGYPAAKLFTLALSLLIAWQTFRMANQLGLERAELTIPLLFLQPAFFLVCTQTLTEPLFALLFVIALRLHLTGRIRAGMLVVSLLVLVRPEGFFLAVLWCGWVLLDRRSVYWTPLLASGAFVWWLAAFLASGDPLWIAHNWPPDWQTANQVSGHGPIWWYFILLPLIVGPLMIPPFVVGFNYFARRRQFLTGISAFVTLFVLHSVLYARGWFAAAGYPRYLVCVSPAIAIITLAGWNRIAALKRWGPVSIVLVLSLLVCVFYVDGYKFTRDARAVDETVAWFRSHQRPVSRLIYSQAYMCIRLDCGPRDKPFLSSDRKINIQRIQESPAQTLILWDAEVGPKWYGLRGADFEALGFTRLHSQPYRLEGWFFRPTWRYHGGPRMQEMWLFYKEAGPTGSHLSSP
jgi:hypothetical protein